MINRTTLNLCLDTLMGCWFALLIWITLVLRIVFPPGTVADGYKLWQLGFDAWHSLHFTLFVGFALLVLVHLMLHWSWVCGVVGNRVSRRMGRIIRIDEANQTIYGVGALIVLFNLLGLALAAAYLSVQLPS
jgi:hypothetical protein